MIRFDQKVQMALAGFTVNSIKFERSWTAGYSLSPKEETFLSLSLISAKTIDLTELDKYQLPLFDSLRKAKLTGQLILSKNGSIHKVTSRAKCTKLSTNVVLKELLIMVKDKPTMVVSNGVEKIDLARIATFLEGK
jgi:hypothetical protein